jgi:hypothetical protein
MKPGDMIDMNTGREITPEWWRCSLHNQVMFRIGDEWWSPNPAACFCEIGLIKISPEEALLHTLSHQHNEPVVMQVEKPKLMN